MSKEFNGVPKPGPFRKSNDPKSKRRNAILAMHRDLQHQKRNKNGQYAATLDEWRARASMWLEAP